jgi:hypothetical protein
MTDNNDDQRAYLELKQEVDESLGMPVFVTLAEVKQEHGQDAAAAVGTEVLLSMAAFWFTREVDSGESSDLRSHLQDALCEWHVRQLADHRAAEPKGH